jgi:hypothetical protein
VWQGNKIRLQGEKVVFLVLSYLVKRRQKKGEEMKKMIVIEECWDCPRHRMGNARQGDCAEKERYVSNADEIPSWCPLQDAPEEEE